MTDLQRVKKTINWLILWNLLKTEIGKLTS